MENYIKQYESEIRNQFDNNTHSTDVIINKVVDKTTIRAYHKNKVYQYNKPLLLYKEWAKLILIDDEVKKSKIIECNSFEEIHAFFTKDLQDFWFNKEEMHLDKIYKVYKIVDLFFKGVTLWEELSLERRKFYYNNVHSPLDQFSLKFLKSQSLILSNEIPKNVSMSFIQNDKEKYNRYQSEIKNISKRYNITPYVFDEIAWRVGHSQEKQNELYKLIEIKK